jgi:hypothetical protein
MLKINSLKQVYSSIYKKYQLKEVYNNLFENEEGKTLRHNLKGRNTNVDFFNETQEVSVPGVGTFQLNKFQTALVGLIIEFYFGNKKVVKDILKNSFGLTFLSEQKQSLDVDRVERFFESCIEKELISNTYEIITDKYFVDEGGDDQVNKGMGYLIEILFAKYLKEETSHDVNYIKFLEAAGSNVHSIYAYSIVYIIYNKHFAKKPTTKSFLRTIQRIFVSELTQIRVTSIMNFIDFGNPEEFFKEIVEDGLRDQGLDFVFDTKRDAVDIQINLKSNGRILSFLDIKSSSFKIRKETSRGRTYSPQELKDQERDLEVYNDEKNVSQNKTKVDEQINDAIGKKKSSSIPIHDFSVGLLRLTYDFAKESIKILNHDCYFIEYVSLHNKILSNKDNKRYYISVDDGDISSSTNYAIRSNRNLLSQVTKVAISKSTEDKLYDSIIDKLDNVSDADMWNSIFQDAKRKMNKYSNIKDQKVKDEIHKKINDYSVNIDQTNINQKRLYKYIIERIEQDKSGEVTHEWYKKLIEFISSITDDNTNLNKYRKSIDKRFNSYKKLNPNIKEIIKRKIFDYSVNIDQTNITQKEIYNKVIVKIGTDEGNTNKYVANKLP